MSIPFKIGFSLLFTAFLAISLILAKKTYRTPGESNKELRLLRAFLPLFLGTVTALIALKVFGSIFDEHSWIRFQKTFVLALGYPLYYPEADGPALATIYGPVSVLAYLPATLFKHPMVTMPVAATIASFFFFLPPLWLHVKTKSTEAPLTYRLSAYLCFAGFAILLTSLRNAAFTVHTDAPTLGLCALAAGLIYFKNSMKESAAFLFASLFAILAVWSKQVAVPIIPALCLYVLLSDGFKKCFKLIFFFFISGLLISGLFLFYFEVKNMLFHMFEIPSRQPFKDGGFAIVFKSFTRIAREWIVIGLWGIFSLGPAFGQKKAGLRKWLQNERWFLFVLISLFMTPVAILSNIKVGGSNNTLSYATYFFLIASTLGFISNKGQSTFTKSFLSKLSACRVLVALSALSLLIYVPSVYGRILTSDKDPNFALKAYRYLKDNPGKAYFPRLTLIHLLAEKKLYHTIDGLMDRHWADMPVEGDHLRSYIPSDAELIGFYGENHMWLLPLEDFPTGAKGVEPLPDFFIYKKNPLSAPALVKPQTRAAS